jgi:hypothetical protein
LPLAVFAGPNNEYTWQSESQLEGVKFFGAVSDPAGLFFLLVRQVLLAGCCWLLVRVCVKSDIPATLIAPRAHLGRC